MQRPFRMRLRQDRILEIGDAADHVNAVVVQFFYERVRARDADLIFRARRFHFRYVHRIRNISGIILDIDDDGIQFGALYEIDNGLHPCRRSADHPVR